MTTKPAPTGPTLPASVSTVQDLKSLIQEIRTYAKWFNQQSVKQRAGVRTTADGEPLLSAAADGMLHAPEQRLTMSSLDSLLEDLGNIAANAPRANITLAAPPTKGIKTSLTDWCRQNIDPDILVSFDFNSTILGGMVVRYGSHVYDWSFRRQILAGRQQFPKHLRPTS